MRIEFHTQGIDLTRELRDYIERRLLLALDRIEVRVGRVRVSLVDVNGPRGGVDKRCQLQIELAHLARQVIVETHEDVFVAIDGAVDRANRTVARQLGRQRDAVRRGRGEHRQVELPDRESGVAGQRDLPLPSATHGSGGQYGRDARV